MSYQVSLQRRIQELKKAQQSLTLTLIKVSKEATKRAVEAAMDATPPKKGTDSEGHVGVNMRTGELKEHWATDSVVEPLVTGGKYETFLKNDMEYASYVDQGHRMDRHFVPGLYVDENGVLNYDPARNVGLVVGTKTKYVKGEFMVDKAREAYEKAVLAQLDEEIERLFK